MPATFQRFYTFPGRLPNLKPRTRIAGADEQPFHTFGTGRLISR